MSEKLCLQWNDYRKNATWIFENLRSNVDFADVTLACEDGEQFEANKLVLAGSSPVFENILKRNEHPHPLIYLRGFKSYDLLALLDFLYCGETNVNQENLGSFLALAQEFQLKGLKGKTDGGDIDEMDLEVAPVQKHQSQSTKKRTKKSPKDKKPLSITQEDKKGENFKSEHDDEVAVADVLMSSSSGLDDELDSKCRPMMEKTFEKQGNGYPLYKCTQCGKQAIISALKKHIENKHLEGISIPCTSCERTFGSRSALGMHNRRNHKHLL